MSIRTLWVLYRREMRGIFVSPVAWIVLAGCAVIVGAGFSAILSTLLDRTARGFSILNITLTSYIFWFTVLIQTPLISMRSFSEEYKMGTIEMLLTAPVREWEVVLSKFAAVFSFYLVLWLPAALNIVWLYTFSDQVFDLTWPVVFLSFGMVSMLGMLFVSIGLFTSAMTKNQIIAAIVGFALVFLIFSISIFGSLVSSDAAQEVIRYFSVYQHMEGFSGGVFDTRPVVFYLSTTFLFLFLTQRVLEARRLRA
ncbi:ABC-2 type transport system permease protein [Verrucomicrobium sp. GAS474]|uniref:ABC transporter permease n=1 Tax=Verrucomicrobium sp. GAS474 TaxID=1882831 RepID=UPI0008797D57|nr:ABC transporter permease [Verrucomicrobium sp. GAS474]SDU07698.1 ABC-2 type transport system permease protein [Verrucomicrobium sp. GAS474]